jgi:hypothetical protein
MTKKRNKRQELQRLHNHKYTRHYTNEGYYCFYCNDPADCLDHVPPLSLIDTMPYEERKRFGIPAALVPCCKECNSALGDRVLVTIEDRLLYLESYYDKFFNKQKAMWTDDEIKELGSSLQNMVRSRQEKLQRFVHKIRAIQLRQIKVETHPIFEVMHDEEKH